MDGTQPELTAPVAPAAGATDLQAAAEETPGTGESPVAAAGDVGRDAAPPARPGATPRRTARAPKPAVELPRLALPGVSSAEILAELQRRRRRADQLLAERVLVVQEMQAVEAALEMLGP